MTNPRWRYLSTLVLSVALAALVAAASVTSTAVAQEPDKNPEKAPAKKSQEADRDSSKGPAAEIARAESNTVTDTNDDGATAEIKDPEETTETPGPNPDIQRLLEFAREGYRRMTDTIHDYTCVIIKREPQDNPRDGYQYMAAKIRHEQHDGDHDVPFSVYLKFLKPDRVKGREVLFVQNQFHGDVIARRGGRRSPNMTLQLDPKSPLALEGNRYPITEIGIKNLTKQLIGVLEQELTNTNCEVRTFKDARLYDRVCTHFLVRYLERKPDQRYYMARVLVDDELKIPVYFASFDWPRKDGGKPVMLEEYAYRDIKINVGLKDRDFDIANPEYHFKQIEPPPETILDEDPPPTDAKQSNAENAEAGR